MNKGDITKNLLVDLVVKFNQNIVSKDQPLPTGKKKGEDKARLEKELVSAAKELLQPGDEQFFDETDITLMNALGINFARLTKTTPLVGESAETTECNLEDEVTPPAVEEAPVEAPTTPVKKKRGAKKAKTVPTEEHAPAEKAVAAATPKAKKKNDVEKDRFGFGMNTIMHTVAQAVVDAGAKGITVKEIKELSWNTRKDAYKAYWMKLVDGGFAEFKDGTIKIVK